MPEPNTREEQFYDAIAAGETSGLIDNNTWAPDVYGWEVVEV